MEQEENRLGYVYDQIPQELRKIVLLQSGGLDSNICASIFNYYGFEVHNIFVNYGQNSAEYERQMAIKVSEKYGGTFDEVTLSIPWLKKSTKLVNHNTPVKASSDTINDYKELHSNLDGEYVPMRNLVLLSIASSYAEANEIPYIGCAFDGDEDPIYHLPIGGTTDKHPRFVEKVTDAINEGSSYYHLKGNCMAILTPLMFYDKPQIVKVGLLAGADMSISRSCYSNTKKPCGVCSACKVRKYAFDTLGIKDPALK